jgi:hypothetical protein
MELNYFPEVQWKHSSLETGPWRMEPVLWWWPHIPPGLGSCVQVVPAGPSSMCRIPQAALHLCWAWRGLLFPEWLGHQWKCLYKVNPIYPFHGRVNHTGMLMEYSASVRESPPWDRSPQGQRQRKGSYFPLKMGPSACWQAHTPFLLAWNPANCSPWLFSDEIKSKEFSVEQLTLWIYEMLWGKSKIFINTSFLHRSHFPSLSRSTEMDFLPQCLEGIIYVPKWN